MIVTNRTVKNDNSIRKINIQKSPKRGGSSDLDAASYLKELNVEITECRQPIQFTNNINEHIHRWAPYVQGFSASFVQSIFDRYKHEYPRPTILDPFAGCGTVLVQAKINGYDSLGTELNPLLHFIANTKVNCWDVSPHDLLQTYRSLYSNDGAYKAGMIEDDIGYYEHPKNGWGIKRARTTKQLRAWEISRELSSLEAINREEFGAVAYPAVYILFEPKHKAYIDEAKNFYNRLKNHFGNPDDKITKWTSVLVINDGRPATQSEFNDTAVRKALEFFLIELFKYNKYTVVSQGERQSLNAPQNAIVESLKKELVFLLTKMNKISRQLEERGQEEVFGDQLRKIVEKSGKRIIGWGKYEALIDNVKVFIRPGSKKPRGWQITFRGRKPGSPIDSLQKGKGYLLFSRNGVLMIPLTEVQKVIADESAYKQDTIDIWIIFEDEKVILGYKKGRIDVTKFKLIK